MSGKAISGTAAARTQYEQTQKGGVYSNFIPGFFIELVTTGDPVTSGTLNFPAMGVLATFAYANTTVATFALSQSVRINSSGCVVNPGSAAISVRLPAIDVSDLPATGPIPAGNAHARTFNINLTCDNGITPKYTVDGTGNLLLFVSDVFANASTGNGIGTGVGIQLFEGDLTSTKVLTLGQAHAANRTTTLNQQISIPITARYYRYADRVDQVTPGLINVPAIFTMTYE
jgi:type 1 fimbria pilin